MKILALYHNPCALELFDQLKRQSHEVYLCTERITSEWCTAQSFDLAVSYTYPYLLTGEVIRALHGNVVNLHNAYLPYNRGADPNLWSILEQTPRGVTLHYISEKLDGGDIIAQSIVPLCPDMTLHCSYYELDAAAKKLFAEAFLYYDFWPQLRKKQLGNGTYHSIKDGAFMKDYVQGYEISAAEFRKRCKAARIHAGSIDGSGGMK